MKKFVACVLALVLALPALALADTSINPQQKGHIAYLEDKYGAKKATQIVSGYSRGTIDTKIVNEINKPENPTEDTGIIIPQPDVNTPVWKNLKVGDYFTQNGVLYYVGRFDTVVNARVMVAFVCSANGVPDPSKPRYFYL